MRAGRRRLRVQDTPTLVISAIDARAPGRFVLSAQAGAPFARKVRWSVCSRYRHPFEVGPPATHNQRQQGGPI